MPTSSPATLPLAMGVGPGFGGFLGWAAAFVVLAVLIALAWWSTHRRRREPDLNDRQIPGQVYSDLSRHRGDN
ncbi:MAG: hypothetical protein ABIZ07_09200 [Dermatophilaceae bacterium]